MNGKCSAHSTTPIPASRVSLGYWSGFSVFLFVVVLSVFSWVVQRRVAQYESIQQAGGHHLTATKVCLTDRNGISGSPIVETGAGAGGFTLLIAALFLAAAPILSPRTTVELDRQQRRSFAGKTRPGLTHFFFLPPPSFLCAS